MAWPLGLSRSVISMLLSAHYEISLRKDIELWCLEYHNYDIEWLCRTMTPFCSFFDILLKVLTSDCTILTVLRKIVYSQNDALVFTLQGLAINYTAWIMG